MASKKDKRCRKKKGTLSDGNLAESRGFKRGWRQKETEAMKETKMRRGELGGTKQTLKQEMESQ